MQQLLVENRAFFPHLLEIISEGHTVTIVARGYSMMPFIEHNRDKLVFGKLQKPKVGDVVLAEINKGVYVCHRIENITGRTVTLRGDGNIRGTEFCQLEDLRAHLVAVIRKGKQYDLGTSAAWKRYSLIWPRLLPFRRILLALYRLLWNHQLPRRFTRNK